MDLNRYTLAGYENRQTGSIWSSDCWLCEQAGKIARKYDIHPIETKKSRGYSVIINRVWLIKFNTKTLEFESITRKGK